MKYHSKHLGADIAGKEDAQRLAPNPAAAEMIGHLDECGIETVLDRFEAQQPQCGFGLRGLCCRMCQWGPCKITAKSPRGVCGRTMELIVMANLLRAAAAGASAQAIHAHDMILTLLGVSRGEITLDMKGSNRLRDVGYAMNVAFSWSPLEEIAEKVAEVMLEDLSRMTDGDMRGLKAFAPKERRAAWAELGVLPRSASFEVLEAMHMTTMGACSDDRAMFLQALRTSLAYAYSGLVTSSVVSDILFGVPEPVEAEVNYGVLKPDHVNILVHGHSPVMLEKILEKVEAPEIKEFARETGAAGILVGGMCCTGHEALSRHGVPTVTGAMGQELIVGTGAVDAVVVDMQCVLPGMQAVAECFGTEIVTTCRSNRIPGATHVPFDPEHPETLDEDAVRVVRMAIEAFGNRDRTQIHIPEYTTKVMTGFTRESVFESFGSVRKMVPRIAEGEVRGIVAMVGCSTPKAGYETAHVEIARELVSQGILVLASGCSAHAMLNAGLCSPEAAKDAAPGLRAACEAAGIPPVLVVGSCSDNTRIIQVFAGLAHEARLALPQMPFVVSGPELANEKTIGQMLAVLAHGLTTVVGLTPSLPIPALGPSVEAADAGSTPNRNSMVDFFCDEGLPSLVGSRLVVEPVPSRAALAIVSIIDEKRSALGWTTAAESAASLADK
ncbi:MAG: anaerobic carbon-monoxide dehydrogenase catalytic subunit [Coriobacteriales bacterium]|nr:anaerobic carbon-monoxide dehydrogenase catalytic subunit [Coriobacteriales bacterium]